MNFLKLFLTILFVIALSGCKTTIERPESITLKDALKEVVEALDAMSEVPVKSKHGLVPAEVTVTFNITAGKKEGKTASIDIVPTGIIKEISGISSGWTSEVSETRGNTISIKFRSILFANEKELIGIKKPEEINTIYEQLEKLGWTIKSQNPSE